MVFAIDLLLPSSALADPYFDWLRSQPEVVIARAYDNQPEIDQDINAVNPANRNNPPVYDANLNAARWSMFSSISVRDQLRPEFGTVSSGTLLIGWDARWDRRFTGDLGEMTTHKAFQLSKSGSGDTRRIEIRTRFNRGSGNDVAGVDARGYIWNPSGQPLPGQVRDFTIEADTWTRFWAFVDFDNQEFSLWVADENVGAVKLFDRLRYNNMSGGLDNFWFEFNSSQNVGARDELRIWARNFAVLRNVSDVGQIVARGSPVRPKPPTNLTAE